MTAFSCARTRPLIPLASICSGPLQDIEMTAFSCIGTRDLIPLNHCRIFKCPCLAKLVHAKYVYRYPWSFSHIKAASCPCFAAQADIASPSMHENTRCAHSKIQACKYPCWCAHSKMSNRPYEAALFKMTRRCLTSFPASSRYSSTQDTDDTTFSIVVVLSALTLVLRYISRKMREVPPMNLKNPMPRNVKTSLSTSGGRSYIVL